MPVDALVLLFLLALALFVFQYATLAKLAALGWVGRYESVGHFVDALNGRDIRFAASDVLLATLILALLAALAWCQWRRGSLGLLWRRLGRRRTLWLVGTGALVLGRFYLAPGLLSWTGDAPAHISYAHQAALTLAAGELPVWSNLIGAGSPYLQFYGFLFFYLVAAINLVFGDLYWSLKVALVGCHVLAALGMYSWGQAATGSRRSGLLAALAYTLCFWHTQQILIMGRLPLALFYALLPWPFYFFERLRRPQRGLENALAGGIVLGLLVWTHPGYGFWAGFFLTGYIGLRLAARWRRGQVLYGLLLLGIGTLWGGSLAVPMWLERQATGLHQGLSLAHIPGPTWGQLLCWSNFHLTLGGQPAHWYGGYLGLSLVGLGLVGVLAPLADRRWRRSCGPAAGACAFVALVLAMAYHWAPLQALAPVRALNPGRYLVFVSFFIALAAGVGGQILARRRTAFWGWALLALLVDLGPTTFLHGYVDAKTRDMISGTAALEGLRSEVAALPVGQVPAYRLFISTGAVHSQLAVGAVHVEGIPTFQSLHPGAVRASTAFGRPLEQLLNQVLEPLESPAALALHPLADVVSGGLGLFNTRYVLINQPDRYFFSAQGLAHTPVLASAAALPYTEKDDFFEDRENLSAFIRGLGVDVASSTCRQLELRGLAAPVALGTPPQVTVLEHRVWPQRVSLRLRLDSPAFVRLAYAWFPSLAVEVDGVSAPVWQTATRCIALRLPAGEHQIELVPRLSDWRLGLLVLDVFIVFAWVAVRFRCHKKRMA